MVWLMSKHSMRCADSGRPSASRSAATRASCVACAARALRERELGVLPRHLEPDARARPAARDTVTALAMLESSRARRVLDRVDDHARRHRLLDVVLREEGLDDLGARRCRAAFCGKKLRSPRCRPPRIMTRFTQAMPPSRSRRRRRRRRTRAVRFDVLAAPGRATARGSGRGSAPPPRSRCSSEAASMRSVERRDHVVLAALAGTARRVRHVLRRSRSRRDQPDARRRAAPDLVQQAGARAVAGTPSPRRCAGGRSSAAAGCSRAPPRRCGNGPK